MTKRKKLNTEQKNFVINLYKKEKNITKVARSFASKYNTEYTDDVRKKLSFFLNSQNLANNKIRLEDSEEFIEASKRKLSKSKYYIITWEQNETPIHTQLWENILAYKEFLGAELSVILGRYKNPTSVFTDKSHENWNKETKPYWDSARHDIHKYLTVLSDVKISPTRKYPLTGIQGLSQGKSIVIGHPKMHLKTEPVLNGHPKKMLFTTGAITLPNYTDSGAGAISDGVHKYGFIIVEIASKDVFYIRQVEANTDGNFIDLCYEVKETQVTKINNALGMVCGDSHHWSIDPKIDKQNDLICNYFNINQLVLHDVVDGESCNNHIIKSPLEQYKRFKSNRYDIEKEMNDLGSWLETKLKFNPIIPSANHNARFDRVLDNDWRKDIPNSLFYLKYTQAVLEEKVDNGVIAYYLNDRFGNNIKCLGYQDSYKIGKYECSQHGDWGSNGSKGSPVTFRNLEIPIILAHTHTPYRADDCFYVGTNTHLNLGYNEKGASSWQQSNVLIAKNGIAQHILFVKGNFTTFVLN